jgi:calcium-dependent protein kinase
VFKCYNKQNRAIRAVKSLLKSGFYNEEEK